MSASINLAWPPPPGGGAPNIRIARDLAPGPTTQPPVKRRWYASLTVTMLAFVFFPPLGLALAARFHGLWQRPIWIRVAAITITAVFVVTLFTANPSNGNSSASVGQTDGGPLLTNVEAGESLDGSTTPDEKATTAQISAVRQQSATPAAPRILFENPTSSLAASHS